MLRNIITLAKVDYYIRSLVKHGWITPEVASYAITIFRDLMVKIPNLDEPNVAPGPNNNISFVWSGDYEYLSIIVQASKVIEIYYEEIFTGKIWSEETNTILSNEVIEQLKRFTRKIVPL